MEYCIFCKISNGEIPCSKIWEDENYLSFLDINPLTEGMTLVIPKVHQDSYIFKNKDEDINNLMLSAKKVSKMIEKSLKISRVGVIFEGIEVDHLHIKLLPLKENESIHSILHSNYPRPDFSELSNLAEKIAKDNQ